VHSLESGFRNECGFFCCDLNGRGLDSMDRLVCGFGDLDRRVLLVCGRFGLGQPAERRAWARVLFLRPEEGDRRCPNQTSIEPFARPNGPSNATSPVRGKWEIRKNVEASER